MLIRVASLQDANDIAELTRQLGYPATDSDISSRMERLIGSPDHLLLVASVALCARSVPLSEEIPMAHSAWGSGRSPETNSEQPGRDGIIGTAIRLDRAVNHRVSGWMQASSCLALESGFRVEIIGLVVSENHRRAGIGRALVAAAEVWASGIGADTIIVRSNIKRRESHAFYPAIGYVASKTQMLYRKSLTSSAPDGDAPVPATAAGPRSPPSPPQAR